MVPPNSNRADVPILLVIVPLHLYTGLSPSLGNIDISYILSHKYTMYSHKIKSNVVFSYKNNTSGIQC